MKLFKRLKEKKNINPWDKFYKRDKRNISVPDISIYSYFENTSSNRNKTALNYFGRKTSYKDFINKIDLCAKALCSQGVRKNDVVTICMPNTPEAIITFFAVNKIGAISNLIHPLSSTLEIKQSIISTKSVFLVSVNLNYEKIKEIINDTDIYKTVIVSPRDSMPALLPLIITPSPFKLVHAP